MAEKKQQLKATVTDIRSRMMNVKLTEDEFSRIFSNARKFAGGNISAWVRYAAMNLAPKQGDLTAVEKS